MVASKRERIIGLVTAGVLAVLALDRLVLTPLTDRRTRLGEDIAKAELELQEADGLFKNNKRMTQKWNVMLAGGLKSDVPESQVQALHALRDWAQESGLPPLMLLKPDRVDTQKQFQIVTIKATAAGSMRSISEFLWRIQESDIPLRVTDMQISTRKEGTDDLMLQLGLSTLCLAPEPTPGGGGGGGGRPGQSVASAGTLGREGTR